MDTEMKLPYSEIVSDSMKNKTPKDLNEFNYEDVIVEIKNKVAISLNDNSESDYSECLSSLSILDQLFEKANKCEAVFRVNNGVATFIKGGKSCKISMTEFTESDVLNVLDVLEG